MRQCGNSISNAADEATFCRGINEEMILKCEDVKYTRARMEHEDEQHVNEEETTMRREAGTARDD